MIMTLDEAIQHCLEVVERNKDIVSCKSMIEKYGGENLYKSCEKCANEHEQLVEWLKELKEYRRFNGAKTFDNGFKQGEKYGYKKAIDDFADKISTYFTCDDYGNVIGILEIVEELKKECAE